MVAPADPIPFALALGSPHHNRPSGSHRAVRYYFVIALGKAKEAESAA